MDRFGNRLFGEPRSLPNVGGGPGYEHDRGGGNHVGASPASSAFDALPSPAFLPGSSSSSAAGAATDVARRNRRKRQHQQRHPIDFLDGNSLQQASETELVELERSIGRLRTQRSYIARLGEEIVAKDDRIAELEQLADQLRDRIRLVERNNEDVDALAARAKKAEESARIAADESAKKSMEVARMFEYVLGEEDQEEEEGEEDQEGDWDWDWDWDGDKVTRRRDGRGGGGGGGEKGGEMEEEDEEGEEEE